MPRLILSLEPRAQAATVQANTLTLPFVVDAVRSRTANVVIVSVDELTRQVRDDLAAQSGVARVVDDIQAIPQVVTEEVEDFLQRVRDLRGEENAPLPFETDPTVATDGGRPTIQPVLRRPAAPPEPLGAIGSIDDSRRVTGVDALHEQGIRGEGVIAAVVDTGTPASIIRADRQLDGLDLTGEGNPWSPISPHGGMTTGIFAGDETTPGIETGYAPGTDVFPIKTTLAASELIQAQDALVSLADRTGRPVVVNNSWGFPQCEGICDHPVTAAIDTAAVHPRIYQVFAAGNCLTGDTKVMTASGPKRIDEVEAGDMVYSFTGGFDYKNRHDSSYEDTVKLAEVGSVYANGVKQVYEVETRTRTIRATANHPFLVLQKSSNTEHHQQHEEAKRLYEEEGAGPKEIAARTGANKNTIKGWVYKGTEPQQAPELVWKPLQAISEGDLILASKELPDRERQEGRAVTKGQARVLGLYLADGWTRTGRPVVKFALPEEPERGIYKEIIQKEFGCIVSDTEPDLSVRNSELKRQIDSYGFGHGALNKQVPNWVYTLPNEKIREFIRGYADGDGHHREADDGTTRYVFESPNIKLMEQIRHLSLVAGFRATRIRTRQRHIDIKTKYGGYTYDKTFATFSITNLSPSSKEYHGWSYGEDGPAPMRSGSINPPKYTLLERIESITPAGTELVYDIGVPATRNFWANGLFVHNSGGSTVGTCGAACDGSAVGISGPNSLSSIVSVAATGFNGVTDAIMPYSSRGGGGRVACGREKPDVAAPVFGTVPWGAGSQDIGNGGGTSAASPQVAGADALLLGARGAITNRATANAIETSADQPRGVGFDGCTGWGILRADRAVEGVSLLAAGVPAGARIAALGLAAGFLGAALRRRAAS